MHFTSKAFYVWCVFPGLRVFMKLSADKLLVFKWAQAHVQFFFNLQGIKRIISRTNKILISNWLRMQKLSQFLQAGYIFRSLIVRRIWKLYSWICAV